MAMPKEKLAEMCVAQVHIIVTYRITTVCSNCFCPCHTASFCSFALLVAGLWRVVSPRSAEFCVKVEQRRDRAQRRRLVSESSSGVYFRHHCIIISEHLFLIATLTLARL
eukprot:6194359-Pleurochrysis_carterae.AAC.1